MKGNEATYDEALLLTIGPAAGACSLYFRGTVEHACMLSARCVETNPCDLPFALIDLFDASARSARRIPTP
jgi:hypothetical protein